MVMVLNNRVDDCHITSLDYLSGHKLSRNWNFDVCGGDIILRPETKYGGFVE